MEAKPIFCRSLPRKGEVTHPDRITAAINFAFQFMIMAQRNFLLVKDDHGRAIHLTNLLAVVGNHSQGGPSSGPKLKQQLGLLVAFTVLWLSQGRRNYHAAIKAVAAERQRQKALFATKLIGFDCASPIVSNRRKFCVLLEECGEVAHAMDQIEHHGMAAGNLKMELTHVAAVGVAWLEALEQERK